MFIGWAQGPRDGTLMTFTLTMMGGKTRLMINNDRMPEGGPSLRHMTSPR